MSSTDGYIAEIGVPQLRHLPCKAIQLKTGTLSYGFMAEPQLGQRDDGETIDTPAGIRVMQTFRKLPIKSPKRKNAAIATLHFDIALKAPQLGRQDAVSDA